MPWQEGAARGVVAKNSEQLTGFFESEGSPGKNGHRGRGVRLRPISDRTRVLPQKPNLHAGAREIVSDSARTSPVPCESSQLGMRNQAPRRPFFVARKREPGIGRCATPDDQTAIRRQVTRRPKTRSGRGNVTSAAKKTELGAVFSVNGSTSAWTSS